MYKLVLIAGDRVRNIHKRSPSYRCEGVVKGVDANMYHVVYSDGIERSYLKELAHTSLEKIEQPKSKCTCVHDEFCERCARQVWKSLTFMERYGVGQKTIAEATWNVLGFERSNGRKVLKRERRNVITGMTQSDMMRQHGARGVSMFNTRATGRSTGQAFRILGEAMCNPGVAIRIQDVDHAISEGKGNRWELNKHFERVLRDTIGGMKGFNFEHGHITFNPIVTEETYVTQ